MRFLGGRGLLAEKVDIDLCLVRLWGYIAMD